MSESFLEGKVTLHRGDCLEVMATLEPDSVDSVVCDPPYHLTSIVKRFGSNTAALAQVGKTGAYARASKGFMGKQWDGGGIAFDPATWALVLRVLKPGGHLLAFSGTRTYHRMACAIEDAGFEIRDQIGWCYGSGFPKSHDIAKGLDRMAGAEREVLGVAGKSGSTRSCMAGDFAGGEYMATAPATDAAIRWQGWGTALKPAWESICLARKPLSEPSIAANVLKHGTGGINVDGCRIASEGGLQRPERRGHGVTGGWANYTQEPGEYGTPDGKGRWPANLIHDGSEEVLAGFPETESHGGGVSKNGIGFGELRPFAHSPQGDSGGSAARFFYTAKADADDRLGSKHPTVKPLDLMQYLVRLVTPKGGLVLDPFAGTGTTGEAAWREGMRAVLIEREAEYQADIVKRMELCLAGPDERRAASVKQESHSSLPLFGGEAA